VHFFDKQISSHKALSILKLKGKYIMLQTSAHLSFDNFVNGRDSESILQHLEKVLEYRSIQKSVSITFLA
jgi:hypothetical protein